MSKPHILSTISVGDSNPFFFSNPLVSTRDTVFIAQPAKSENNALYILDVWNNENYNIGDTDLELQGEISFTRAIYHSNSDIEIHEVRADASREDDDEQKRERDERIVLIYKKNKILHYIALLPYKVI